MKKCFLIALLIFSYSMGNAQSDTVWYKVFTGKLGNMDATLHLCRNSNSFSGYIWFTQLQWPMPVYGATHLEHTDSIQISAGNTPMTLTITGKLSNKEFAGHGELQKDNLPMKGAHFLLKENTGKGLSSFQYYYVAGNGKLPPKLKNESECSFSSATVWPIENNSFTATLKKHLSLLLQSKVPVNNPVAVMNSQKNKFISAWQKENSILTPKDAADLGFSLSASQDQNIMVMYENEKNITLASYVSEYSGGAHNNYATELINFDKLSGKKLSLKDVFTPQGIRSLPLLLDQVARLQFGIKNRKPLDENDFFVKQINATENFYITSAGIGFLYPPYALKSFAEGEINLLVPKAALNKYLLPAYR